MNQKAIVQCRLGQDSIPQQYKYVVAVHHPFSSFLGWCSSIPYTVRDYTLDFHVLILREKLLSTYTTLNA